MAPIQPLNDHPTYIEQEIYTLNATAQAGTSHLAEAILASEVASGHIIESPLRPSAGENVSLIRTAVIGTGFMGRVHMEALRRLGTVEIAAVSGRSLSTAQRLANSFGVACAVDDYHSLLTDQSIDAIHICTPNAAHFDVAKAALLAGKHVLCEKPIGISTQEARELTSLAAQTGLRNGICHNLRGYPMVQQMRRACESGMLGDILIVQGTYSQDWLLHDTDWNWRIDPATSGPMRVMADIGSHWFDMAEHITGLRVTSLCSDLQIVHPARHRPNGTTETFAGKLSSATDMDMEKISVTTEDFGAVLFHLGDRARGSMTASQVSAGRKNQLRIEISGSIAAMAWDQERPNELWIGHRNAPNEMIIKDPSLLLPSAQGYAELPGGHAEGYPDTFKQLFRRFYESIANPQSEPEYPTFVDGLRQMSLLDHILVSHQQRKWVDIESI